MEEEIEKWLDSLLQVGEEEGIYIMWDDSDLFNVIFWVEVHLNSGVKYNTHQLVKKSEIMRLVADELEVVRDEYSNLVNSLRYLYNVER